MYNKKKKLSLFILSLIAFCVLLTSCQTLYENTYDYKVDLWMGHHVDELVMSWGVPQNSYKFSNGAVAVEYVDEKTSTIRGRTYYETEPVYEGGTIYGPDGTSIPKATSYRSVAKRMPDTVVKRHCKTTFTTDRDGIIIDWSYEGDACQ